ncbi:putative cleavage and polyadenylation specificity factor [Encephalitozoon intestinalis ATCC 50506]|uniref:Cleavage and polyadenylation specificity factor subunit 2 n=1 Tax=Encephalitozoon intestinalis (strain ATCC 50506) TaxID=876142 RepID=E0S758_ENCIT|nr:putative cleavage and polyadenylation specificity factor [Encephalitozoon intestinalis ATCC 50506]ADM11486.1 putative cleavage and polyadenylation specificity factor [Encephalitozoon intestinalis ATCC 50506]UTX45198.1 cleavage and polyadenylation specificity factor [Encephalitozoon intestinalis]
MPSSFVSLTPLIRTETGIYCHLLEVDNVKILINCGASYTMDMSIYAPILPQILSCDAILLTSFGINCIGGLPYILQNNYYNKVFSSVPVKVLGKICLDEHLRGMGLEAEVDIGCFERISEIKYSQPTMVNDVEICAYNSGNSIGGCLYKISKGAEKIVVGFNANHRKENHLDGMGFAGVGDCSLCVFNGNHVLAENISIAKRDNMFREAIGSALDLGRKVILPVKYSRFLEVALILNSFMGQRSEKIACLSYFGQRFVERAKSMIEWAGEKVSSMFSEEKINPFEFEKIEFIGHYRDVSEFDVIIVIDEYVHGGILTTVLHKFNDENNVVFLTDPRMEAIIKKESLGMKWYDFRLVERVNEKKRGNGDIEASVIIDDAPDANGAETHWSETRYEVWCEGGDEVFPAVSRRRAYDDYGEYMDRSLFVSEILSAEEISEEKMEKEVVVEEREVAGEGIVLKYRVEKMDLMGISDLNSCKMIIETISPKKLVCIGEDEDTECFFYHTFKYMPCFEDVYMCRSKIILSSDVSMGMVKLDEGFDSLNYQMIGNDTVGSFRGVRDGDVVRCIGNGPGVMIGHVDINELRRMIIERNMRVEQEENGLLVEDCVWIRINADGLTIDGKDSGVFYAVRDVVYMNSAFI